MLKYLLEERNDCMLRTKDILDEKDPRVRAENTDVEFPLSL